MTRLRRCIPGRIRQEREGADHLGTLGSSGAGKQLVDVTRGEKDPELKKAGLEWLGRMRGSKDATDYLIEVIGK